MVSIGSDNKLHGCSGDERISAAKTVSGSIKDSIEQFLENSRILKIREERRVLLSKGVGITGKNSTIMNKGPGMIPVKPDFRPERVRLSKKGRGQMVKVPIKKKAKDKTMFLIFTLTFLKSE